MYTTTLSIQNVLNLQNIAHIFMISSATYAVLANLKVSIFIF